MRYALIVFWLLTCSVTSAMAQVSIGIGLPGISIGINLPVYPEMVQVPDYPVYYAPRVNANLFFYDGMYWAYQGDNWYASSWYNGPWGLVGREIVPLFVLRIPVQYYRDPPRYFRGWRPDAPPRWGEHWGNDWAQRRNGWDRWNRASIPAPAPLPTYQRQYSGDRYPRIEQQQALHNQNYRYQPRDAVVRQHYQQQAVQHAPTPSQRDGQGMPSDRGASQREIQHSNAPAPSQRGEQGAPADRGARQQEMQHSNAPAPAPMPQPAAAVPRPQPQQHGGEVEQRPAPPHAAGQQSAPAAHEQSRPSGRGAQQEHGQRQEKDHEKGEERGQERNR